jgi:phosphate starvation-inducible PhoH-like protein
LKQIKDPLSVEKIDFADNDLLRNLFGEHDRNVKLIERLAAVTLNVRGNVVSLTGNHLSVALVKSLLSQLYRIAGKGYPLSPADIEYAYRILAEDSRADLERLFLDIVFISA